MKPYHIGIVAVLLLFTIVSKAQSFGIGDIVANGSGCPQGTVSVNTDMDGNLVLQTEQFTAQVVKRGARVDIKSCALAIPLQVPKGFQLVISNAGVEGFSNLKRNARATITAETFIAGRRSPKLSKNLNGPIRTGFVLGSDAPTVGLISKCGESVILRTNVTVTVEGKSRTAVGEVSIEEIRPLAGIEFRTCR